MRNVRSLCPDAAGRAVPSPWTPVNFKCILKPLKTYFIPKSKSNNRTWFHTTEHKVIAPVIGNIELNTHSSNIYHTVSCTIKLLSILDSTSIFSNVLLLRGWWPTRWWPTRFNFAVCFVLLQQVFDPHRRTGSVCLKCVKAVNPHVYA